MTEKVKCTADERLNMRRKLEAAQNMSASGYIQIRSEGSYSPWMKSIMKRG